MYIYLTVLNTSLRCCNINAFTSTDSLSKRGCAMMV